MVLDYDGVVSSAYGNGVLQNSEASTLDTQDSNGYGTLIGRWRTGDYFAGDMDEVRFSTVSRDADWYAAEHLNQATPASFYTASPSEVTGFGSFGFRVPLVIATGTVGSTLTDFPVFVDLSDLDSTFWSNVKADGGDIRLYNNASGELPVEVVSIDTGAQTGELHFRADSIASGSGSFFYLYFDDAALSTYAFTDPFGRNNVWSNGYAAVLHLEESGSGVLDEYVDSTGNGHDGQGGAGTQYLTPNTASGVLGGGQSFEDQTFEYISLPREALDGLADSTVSWWHQTSRDTDASILSGANSTFTNEYWLRWLNSNDDLYTYNSNSGNNSEPANGLIYNDGSWQHHVAVADSSTNERFLYSNGLASVNNPRTGVTIDPLVIDNGGLIIGQDQDLVGGNFSPTESFEGNLDSLRIASVVRDQSWAATEYSNMEDPLAFFATSSPESLSTTEFAELDFWVQHFDYSGEQADIWVQIENLPADGGTIYVYYGNATADSASDEMATFTYDTLTEVYYVVDDHGADSVQVTSLVDNNQVQLEGGTIIDLNRGETTSFASPDGNDGLSILGPVSAVVNGAGADGGDMLAPISFATTTFAVPTSRNVDQWFVYAPFGSTTVDIFQGASASSLGTLSGLSGTSGTLNVDITDTAQGIDGEGAVVEASSPVLLTHRHTTDGDGMVVYPPTTDDLYGVNSQFMHFSGVNASTNLTLTCSAGGGGLVSGITRGDQEADALCTPAAEGAGSAVRVSGQTGSVSAIQQADADGNESTVFWPEKEFGTQYALPRSGAYVAVVCAPRYGSVDVEMQGPSGATIESATCTPGVSTPGKVYFTNGTGNGDTANFVSGTTVVSTNGVPFYAIFEDVADDQDEKNIQAPVQARKYGGDDVIFLAGDQEEANPPVYEQLSFAWYENEVNVTPTNPWSLGSGEFVSEAEPITGAGAINDGDILRLRMSAIVTNATATAGTEAFTLQYTSAASNQCSLATNWFDVGAIGSSTAVFNGYNNPTIQDGTNLPSVLLASSTVAATYEERNFSDFNPTDIGVGAVGEWDWVIEANDVDVNTNYCFRMIRAIDSQEFTTYTLYPELETVGPPNVPTLVSFFDNERTTTLTPRLEFFATDIAGDKIAYEVQIDNDRDFSSVIVEEDSAANFLPFEEADGGTDKAEFQSGETIRFNGTADLAASTTYWWRVRASDPSGSATSSAWSEPFSFTTDTVIETSEWYQTTTEQFETNEFSFISASGGSVTGGNGSVIGTPADFDDAVVGNAWGEAYWSDVEGSGEILVQVQFNNNGNWQPIPNSEIPDNNLGTTTSPISLLALDTSVYNELRLVANFTGTGLSLDEWGIRWALRIETPILGDLFDNQQTASTLPVFDFVSTDPQGDAIEYEVSFSSDRTFETGSSTFNSAVDTGFENVLTSSTVSPFTSGNTIEYTTQPGDDFTNGETYWWRARAKDVLPGGNVFSPWSEADAFTIDTSTVRSTWFQTTDEQFDQGVLVGTQATADSVQISTEVGEFGTVDLTGNTWVQIPTDRIYRNMVVIGSSEFDFSVDDGDGRTVRVRNKTANSFEIKVDNHLNSLSGPTTVDYIVMEAGDWLIDDGAAGVRILADTRENVTEKQVSTYSNTVGETIVFPTSFGSNPAAFVTISSNNDSDWVDAHVDGGGTRNTSVGPNSMRVALAIGNHTASVHAGAEDIDYVVVGTGTGTIDSGAFQSLNTPLGPDGFGGGAPYQQPLTGFTSAPVVTIVQNNSETGGQGGFAFKELDPAGTNDNTTIALSVAEIGVNADGHIPEVVSVLALENTDGIISRINDGTLTGEIAGEPIIFSDGAGPKFDNFSWIDNPNGVGVITYQMQYLVSENQYALIPDGALPGNSTGFTSGPIDLTAIDINVYDQVRPFAALACVAGDCPQIDSWKLEWSEGVDMTGTLQEYDRTTAVATGTISAKVSGQPAVITGGIVAGGVWTLPNVTAFEGDIVTVWVDGATESEEAVTAFVYDGLGDITGVKLYEQHLAFDADEFGTITNQLLAHFDNSDDEDIMFSADALTGNLNMCASGVCDSANIYVAAGHTYIPATSTAATIDTHDFINEGTIELDANVLNVSGSWVNNATSSTDVSTINFTATTGSETVTSTEDPLQFHNLSFGGFGMATFTPSVGLDLSGDLTVATGTFVRGDNAITLGGSLSTLFGGIWSGTASTTFDGSGAKTWSDGNLLPQNVGDVIIDGPSTIVTVLSDVSAFDVVIGSNDTLVGGAGNVITVGGDWDNDGTFTAQTSTVEIIVDDRVYPPVVPGSSDWYSDTDFDSRVAIVVDSAEVVGPLTEFPIYVDLSTLGDSFWTGVNAGGADIRVTAGDGQTELPKDLVQIDIGAKTGELHFLADSLSDVSDTTFYIYFDNPFATPVPVDATYGRNATWKNYEAVYHFSDDVTAVTNTVLDSTGNGKTLEVTTDALASSAGLIGDALDLNGTATGYLLDSDWAWVAGDRLESSGWYRQSAASSEALWSWGTGDAFNFMPWYSGTNRGYHRFGSNNGAFTFDFTPRETVNWSHFTTQGATSTSEQVLTYIDGVLRDSPTQLVANPTATGLQIGRYTTAGSLQAEIDELRFATGTRNTDWIETEYTSQLSPTVFYATSSVETYQPPVVLDEATHNITAGGSAFYNLVLNDATTTPAFTEPSVVTNCDFTIATGTVALPTGKLTVGCSFTNNGVFMHNNGEVEFDGVSSHTITLNGTEFLNAFYDVTFDGAGDWTFLDANASTSNNMVIENGTVVFPTDNLTIGGTLSTNGGGFDANNGAVVFTSAGGGNITTRGSSFNDVQFGAGGDFSWLDVAWDARERITIPAANVTENLTDFPVYIDLGALGTDFWNNVSGSGADIRVTNNTGSVELPFELVSIDTVTETGQLHFKADSLSSLSDSVFYVYYGNPSATPYAIDSTYGRNNVWTNGYEAVFHLEETGDGTVGEYLDSTGNGYDGQGGAGVATDVPTQVTGLVGGAQDFENSIDEDYIDLNTSMIAGMSGANTKSVSAWVNVETFSDNGGVWNVGGSGTGFDFSLIGLNTSGSWRAQHWGTPDHQGSFGVEDQWLHMAMDFDGTTSRLFGNGSEFSSEAVTLDTQDNNGYGVLIGRWRTGNYFDGIIDEIRFASESRTAGWYTAEHLNQSNPAAFITSSPETLADNASIFVLNEDFTDIEGDLTISGSRLTASQDTLSIGGSAFNFGGAFDANNATTTFNSNDLGETFDFGGVSLYNLSFDGAGGGWTVSTTTVENNLTLATGASYVQSPNTTMTVGGVFSNQFASPATDWTDSTLVLTGGDYVVTDRNGSGDDYATLSVSNDTDIILWNSTISTSSVRDNSSIYMPDFDGIDGQLNIYGDYSRTAGAEYWSYATDFDGTDLTGGSERQANVFLSGGTAVALETGTALNMVGVTGASTTVQSLFGIYSLSLDDAELNAARFTIDDGGPLGLQLRNGSTITQFTDGDFSVAPGRTGITVDASTVNAQPSTGFTGINFGTSSASTIYKQDWSEQMLLIVPASSTNETLEDFPVYLDLSVLGSAFWSGIQSDGADIRMTTDSGREVPIDLVEIDAVAQTGELHFLAPTLNAFSDSTFYVHYNNPSATGYSQTDEFGANAVWANYEAVYHFSEDPAVGITDMTANNRDLAQAVGAGATSSGQIGTAYDTTALNTMLEDPTWTWQAGDSLVSSGLYYMENTDQGALWQFGNGNGSNNGTYLAFMPNYDNTNRGRHFFGITSGADYVVSPYSSTEWHHFTTIGRPGLGESNEIFEDDTLQDTVNQIATSINPTNTGLKIGRYQTGTYSDFLVDELRFTTVIPTAGWRSAEYSNLTNAAGFYATSSGPTETFNVTTDGVPATFWLFAEGTGLVYGEAFDNDDGDPGSIQWDDSNYNISISGVVYADDGVTPMGAPVCNNSTEVVTVVVGGVDTYQSSCDAATGAYEVTGVTYVGEPVITAYLASDAASPEATVAVLDERTGTGITTGNDMVVNRPDVVDGSVLVLIAGKDDDPVFNTLAGWTEISSLGNTAGDDLANGAWYKVVTDASTEPLTYTFTATDTTEAYSYWIGSLLNVDIADPLATSTGWSTLINPVDAVVPSLTTTNDGSLVFAAAYVFANSAIELPLGSWNTEVDNLVDPSSGHSLNISSKTLPTAGASGDAQFRNIVSGRETQVMQFAFNASSSPTATSSAIAATVTKTPLGAAAQPYTDIDLYDKRSFVGNTNDVTPAVVDRPDVRNGDVLVAIAGREDDFQITAPAGWTLAADRFQVTPGNQMYTAIWTKVVTDASSEPLTYSFAVVGDASNEETSISIASYGGVDTTVIFDDVPVWSNLQNTSNPAAPSITTVNDGAYPIAVWYVIDDPTLTPAPTPWVTLVNNLQLANRNLNVSTKPPTLAGATGDAVMSGGSTDDVNVIQFALKPVTLSVADSISDFDLYQNRTIVRHEDITPVAIADLVGFDNDDVADLPFTATLGSPDTLTVFDGVGLYVWNDKTFDAGGAIDLQGLGTTAADGSFRVGPDATFNANGTDSVTVGGSLYVDTAGTYNADNSLLTFTATNAGQQIGAGASSTVNLYDVAFTGIGGEWAVQTPIVVDQDIAVTAGTVVGIGDIEVVNGDFSGDGLVAMTGGTVQLNSDNTFGGVNSWQFNNLVLGDGSTAGITTPAGNATTTVLDTLTIASGHFLDNGSMTLDLAGSGNVFVRNGTFIQDTGTVRYSGLTPNILRTPYYNLVVDTDSGLSVDATAPVTGLQVLGNLTVGAIGTSTIDLNSADPLTAVNGNVYIGSLGTVEASDVGTLNVFADWDNDGTFIGNGGLVQFLQATGTVTVAAGVSPFANVIVAGNSNYTFTESATSTGNFTIGTSQFVLQSGEMLEVGGEFVNNMGDTDTTWTGTTLKLTSGTAYNVNAKATGDTYDIIEITTNTHPRFWNSDATAFVTEPDASAYSMDHATVDGDLYIFGDFVNTSYNDHWSYARDFDGAALGSPRLANVQIEDGGSVLYLGGSLTSLGTTSASTTISAQGAGPYTITLGGTTTIDMQYYSVREITADGLIITGSPSVTELSRGDFEVTNAGGSAITVGGSVISVNPAKNFTNNRFATTTAINAFNVTATGTSLSSWRFVNVDGNLDGEAKDVDPGGDPGYVVWQDSAAIIDISGVVYQNDRSTASAICDGVTNNIRLVVGTAGATTFASTTCAAGTGAYIFNGIGFGLSDTVTVYIDGTAVQAATVTKDPISLISDMDLYEDHVIVRHESGLPQTIEAMAVYDSSDDADIPFTAVDAATDTLTLAADTALVVWASKDFEPTGDVTIPGGGAGATYDGLLELFTNADYIANAGETHSVGGSVLTGTGALIAPATASFDFTTTASGRTLDLNEAIMFDATFSGSGDWTITDSTFTAAGDVLISGGLLDLPTGTTTLGGSFEATAGAFDANGGLLYFTSVDAGNTVEFGGSDADTVLFAGVGDWVFTDVNATSTDSFTVATGTVTLPSGTLTVTEDFIVQDTIAHNGGMLRMVGVSGSNVVTLSGNDLTDLIIVATGGDYTLTDDSAALLGDLTLIDGAFTVGSGTVSIGGSFDTTGGVYNNGSGTLLFNSATGGQIIDPGANDLYNVVIAGAGGWTIPDNATTTNNFSLTNASAFTLSSGSRLYVGGVFTNTVGGAATTWTGTTLVLDGSNEYETNVKVTPTELYNILELGENTDISSWNSSALTLAVPGTSSFYSQDNAGIDGDLYIYGDYQIGTTTEYWSAATDFDGTVIGSPRQANVYIASSSNITLSGGTLEIIGTTATSTSIQNQGVGTYDISATAGTLNADYYNISDMTAVGLDISGTTVVTSLSNGFFTQSANNSSLITLVPGVINNNASLVITDTGFATGGFTGGVNVDLSATTTNSWSFTGALGNLWGEDFDVDGVDECSSIRWDDSSCLLTEQTNYRWRNDDGGEASPDSEWFDTDWSARQRVRVINDDAAVYTNTAVKIAVPFDADMQSDFEDLRFTGADGTTLVDHWIERFDSGSDAVVWIEAPTLAADTVTEFYMYYGNVTAPSVSNGSAVFEVIEDFEDDDIIEYLGGTGDIARFETESTVPDGTPAYGGGFGLRASNVNAKTTDGIVRSDLTVSQGQTIRFMQYIDTVSGTGDEVCTIFAATGTVASNQNYAICTDQIGTDRISIVRDVENSEFSGTILATANAEFTNAAFGSGWYEFYVDWETDDTIDVAVYFESTGALVATTTVTDATYTSGNIGFAFWFQNGGWDSYVAYPRTETLPRVFLGDEQSDGGATWANAQNTPTGGFAFGDTARLRIAIENTGLPIEDQRFELEYAPKLTAPTCEAVDPADFEPVPNVASCGLNAVCMSTSLNVSNGDTTTDHLVTAAGDFAAGQVVTSPSNQTTLYDLDQNRYTELEYALQLTVNADNDAYCFRVTDDGNSLDSYSNLPELTLAFDPTITGVTINNGLDISLNPGTTATITASSTVTDFNGVADFASATTTFYKTSVGAACTPDDNNCYVATSSCSFVNCTANSCSLICTAPFAYHTDPTDTDGAEEWFAFMEVSDQAGTNAFDSSFGVELLTIRALDVQNAIAYGTVDINEDTGAFNPTVSLLNLGNEPIDVQVSGTDMTDGVASVIPASQQRFATSSFDYASCIGCSVLSVIGTPVEVDLPKSLVASPVVEDEIFWGIEVPFGTASAPHTGTNFFMAISD